MTEPKPLKQIFTEELNKKYIDDALSLTPNNIFEVFTITYFKWLQQKPTERYKDDLLTLFYPHVTFDKFERMAFLKGYEFCRKDLLAELESKTQ